MSSIFDIGLSGLHGFQRALSTTSHNIANANTPGYSRQRVDFAARAPTHAFLGTIGQGVDADHAERIVDGFLATQVRGATTGTSAQTTIAELAGRLDAALSTEPLSVGSALDSFAAALGDVANSADSIAAREILLEQSQTLVQQIKTADASVRELRTETNGRLRTSVAQINELSAEVAQINTEVMGLSQNGRAQANDLYDRREEALRQLTEQVGADVVVAGDGVVNVYLRTGQALVVGADSHDLGVRTSGWGGPDVELTYRGVGLETRLDGTTLDGRLGALQQFRDQTLATTANQLGRLATAFANEVNAQHQNGVNLDGNPGANMFAVGAMATSNHSSNVGSAALSAAVADVSLLKSFSYELEYDGADFKLSRQPNGATETLAGSGPFLVDGLQITVDISAGTPVAGDQFRIEPFRDVPRDLELSLVDPRQIAAGVPVLAEPAAGNEGTGSISQGEVIDPLHPDLLRTVSIVINDPPDTYDVTDTASGTVLVSSASYAAGQPIEVNGHRVAISGLPASGDSFSVSATGAAPADNRNVLALSEVLESGLLDGGDSTLRDVLGQTVAGLGATVRHAQNGQAAHEALLAQSSNAREAVSGVNLDEEAANLMQYQQAYEAAARVVVTADELFQTILRATGG